MSDDQTETPEERLESLRSELDHAQSLVRAFSIGAATPRLQAVREDVARITVEIVQAEELVQAAAAAKAAQLAERDEYLAGLTPLERSNMTKHTAEALQAAAREVDGALDTIYRALRRAADTGAELAYVTGDQSVSAELQAAWADVPSLAAYWFARAGVETGAQPRRGSFASRLPGPGDFDDQGGRSRRRRVNDSEAEPVALDLGRILEEVRSRGTGPPKSVPAAPHAHQHAENKDQSDFPNTEEPGK